MGGGSSAQIPDSIDLDTFKLLSGEKFSQDIFDTYKGADGLITKQTLLELNQLTDCFLTHDWGTDEKGRSNHERVSRVNESLKQRGIITWFDSDRMIGNIVAQMCGGIDKSQCVIVFVTQNYVQKVGGTNPNDNCQLEFDYAFRKKTRAKMIAVVMEARMRNTNQWDGAVGMALGGSLYIDLVEDSDWESKMDQLYQNITQLVKPRLAQDKNKPVTPKPTPAPTPAPAVHMPAPVHTPAPAVVTKLYKIVLKEGAVIRGGVELSTTEKGRYQQGTVVEVSEVSKTSKEGVGRLKTEKGWISERLTVNFERVSVPVDEIVYVQVVAEKARIRATKELKSKEIGTMPKGTIMETVDEFYLNDDQVTRRQMYPTGNWLSIESAISNELMTKALPKIALQGKKLIKVVDSEKATIRAGCELSSKKLGDLLRGAIYEYISTKKNSDGILRYQLSNNLGWVSSIGANDGTPICDVFHI